VLSQDSGFACSRPQILSLFELLGCDDYSDSGASISGVSVRGDAEVEAADRGHGSSVVCGKLDVDAGVTVCVESEVLHPIACASAGSARELLRFPDSFVQAECIDSTGSDHRSVWFDSEFHDEPELKRFNSGLVQASSKSQYHDSDMLQMPMLEQQLETDQDVSEPQLKRFCSPLRSELTSGDYGADRFQATKIRSQRDHHVCDHASIFVQDPSFSVLACNNFGVLINPDYHQDEPELQRFDSSVDKHYFSVDQSLSVVDSCGDYNFSVFPQ
jgi:hypothetical protein